MLTIYALAALPFFTGGLVITLAISRLASRINAVYASDLLGAAAGCLVLIPLLDRVGAPGVVLTAAALALTRGRAVRACRRAARGLPAPAPAIMAVALAGQLSGVGGLRRGRHEGTPGRHGPVQQVELVLADRRLRAHARRLVAQPQVHRRAARHALHGHRFGGLDADPARRAGLRQRPVPALRADRHRLSARSSRASPRWSSDPAAAATWCPRSSSAPTAWTASKSTRSSPTTSCAGSSASTRAASTRSRASASRSTTGGASCGGRRTSTTSSRRRSWTPGPPPPPARTR